MKEIINFQVAVQSTDTKIKISEIQEVWLLSKYYN